MPKGIYMIFRTKEDLQRHDAEVDHFARVDQLDRVTLALGRMGFREAKFRELNRTLSEVEAEYNADFKADMKDDKHMVYSLSLLDRELKQYVGKLFAPWAERHR